MKVDIIINDTTSVILTPENELDTQVLKSLCKQSNDIIEIRSGASLLSKQLSPNSVLICKEGTVGSTEKTPDKRDTGSQA